jgi:hypothetical protein
MVPSTVVFGATAVAIGNDPDAPSISKVSGGRPFHRSGWLFREFLKAFTLGFGQQKDCDDQTQDADNSGCTLRSRQAKVKTPTKPPILPMAAAIP